MTQGQPASRPLTAAALLAWYVEAGVEEAVGEVPVDRFAAAPAPQPAPRQAAVPTRPAAARAAPSSDQEQAAREIAAGCATLDALREAIAAFEGCGLRQTAMHTVFADGVAGAPLMLVGEAPGADEDRQGKPFVGAAGKLLDRMLAAIGRDRRENVYISNILPWRPPGNRKPTPLEISLCLPFIRRHIELARPRILFLLGATAAGALLERGEGITRLRGRWHEVRIGELDLPALPSFHPAYLLRTPEAKANSWQDLLALAERLDRP